MEHTDELFAVRDVKGACYGQIIVCPNKALAMRAFMEACEREGPMKKYPSDFMLYGLALYDSRSGNIIPHKVPDYIMSAADVNPEKVGGTING